MARSGGYTDMPEYIYGHWPVMESLRANRRKFEQLILSEASKSAATSVKS